MVDGIKVHWLATMSAMGLEVTHFLSEGELKKAERKAKRDHDAGRIDTYLSGTSTIKLQIRRW